MQSFTQRSRLLGLVSLFCLALVACTQPEVGGVLSRETPTSAAPSGKTTPLSPPENEVKILFIGPERIDCVGETAFPCLRVREDGQAAYENFHDPIDGFNWEPGIEYKLRVRVTRIQDPQASFATLRYVLLEIIDQTPVAPADDE